MTSLRITEFAGILPEKAARNLPKTHAQIAHNCLLWDGVLRPMPQWVESFRYNSATNKLYEDTRDGSYHTTFDYGEGVILTGAPFATSLLVGINDVVTVPGYTSNIFQTLSYTPEGGVSVPAGLPTPTFSGTSPFITSSSVSYSSQLHSLKPVNRIIGVTFCRVIAGGTQESPIAIIPGQAPYGIMFEGDIVIVNLSFDMAKIADYGITHIRLYRTIAGLDSGENVANELDTDWHLIDSIAIKPSISYSNGGAATGDSLDLYLAKDFYSPQFKAAHFGLTESGWFYAVAADGRVAVSERYLHHAWPTENYLRVYEQVTDVACYYDNVYIGTVTKPYVVSVAPGEGEQGAQLAAVPFPERLACIPGTMVAAAGGAIYASKAGLVALSKSGQRLITAGVMNPDDILYKEKIEVTGYDAYVEEIRIPRTLFSANWNGKYVGFTKSYQNVSDDPVVKNCYIYDAGNDIMAGSTAGQIVTMDTPTGLLLDAKVAARGLTLKYSNQLFYLPTPGDGAEEREYRKAKKMCFRWKSKKFVFPGQTTFAAGKIVHDCGGAITIRLFVDCKCVWQADICDCNPFRIPSQIMGVTYEIELIGKNAVQEVHLAGSMRELIENE